MEEQINIEQKEGVKLTRNAKGSYQWEIKVKSQTGLSLNDEDIQRLKEIDEKLRKEYLDETSN